uniref:Rab-GAP TBC domain-containing protein n=1 Tax=Esox lucius TaxID=8010 RepID=A0A6Q2YT79_ESOLU
MMDEGTELSLTIAQIVQRLKGTNLHSQIERQAKVSSHHDVSCTAELKRVCNTDSCLSCLLWEKRILKSLNSMCTELGVPLARKRPAIEQKELTNKWNEMGTDEPDLSRFRPVYAPKDFLEVLISLRNPNHDSSEEASSKSYWGLVQVPLQVRDIPQMREAYSELCLTSGQLGIDDLTHVPPGESLLMCTELALCPGENSLLSTTFVAQVQNFGSFTYSMSGVKYLWTTHFFLLGQDVLHYNQLKAGVIHHDLLVDKLIYKDVKLTASNDDYYFVFEDYLYQVLLCFSRDTAVLDHFSYNSATPPKSYIQGESRCLGTGCVIPFHGFSMYVAPLCFLYNEPSKLYAVFREMYVRYFFRLHSISSSASGIVSLCLQFERLLQTHLPQLFYHLREIGAQPLRVAFKWMVRAFSGYLSTDQLLLLWDRVLGYDSLEIVAVLAAAVFAFRAENLMEVTSLASAEAVLADLSTLKVMPLIQIFLFATVI